RGATAICSAGTLATIRPPCPGRAASARRARKPVSRGTLTPTSPSRTTQTRTLPAWPPPTSATLPAGACTLTTTHRATTAAPATAATALYSLLPGAPLPRPLRRAVEPWQSGEARPVGWATAACLVARTETLKELGPFDESIFLYAEDLDLGLRTETWFHPQAR